METDAAAMSDYHLSFNKAHKHFQEKLRHVDAAIESLLKANYPLEDIEYKVREDLRDCITDMHSHLNRMLTRKNLKFTKRQIVLKKAGRLVDAGEEPEKIARILEIKLKGRISRSFIHSICSELGYTRRYVNENEVGNKSWTSKP